MLKKNKSKTFTLSVLTLNQSCKGLM